MPGRKFLVSRKSSGIVLVDIISNLLKFDLIELTMHELIHNNVLKRGGDAQIRR